MSRTTGRPAPACRAPTADQPRRVAHCAVSAAACRGPGHGSCTCTAVEGRPRRPGAPWPGAPGSDAPGLSAPGRPSGPAGGPSAR
ncbi:hypothetical protein [Ornithinimicrobium kibberense]|uniref:hypothetical protein n=1 Tax=Ornithinimicrobium kibberense TaxID=282060 RepID=UPI00360C5B52